jgi:GNAT superfamily N-acetyltransferase
VDALAANPQRLVDMHLALEGIGVDRDGRLVRLPAPDAEEIPRFYAARFAGGECRYRRQDLAEAIARALYQLPLATVFGDPAAVQRLLAGSAGGEIWLGKSYVADRPIPAAAYPDVVRLDQADHLLVERFDPQLAAKRRPVFALLIQGEIAATCVSTHENAQAGAAWVQTSPRFRRRGYGRQVTAAWAAELQRLGKLPLYSHHWDNVASQALVESLGFRRYAEDIGYP